MTEVWEEHLEATEEELDRLDAEMKARWAAIGAQMVTKRDIDRCPKHAWSPHHYYPDGSCRCGEREEAMAMLKQTNVLRQRAIALHHNARAWLDAT